MNIKNLMVTGGCGFIGSNFIRYLLEEADFGGRIINVDKLTYAG
ncbi:MAG: NAD-dependent epimerase/dehydratase family protein, partial [Deltaproteobacteria bacterium]|nr:NAD-dependent epimerase/dehydratase family protein [Deltaproteobacteria bacterium]